MLRAIEFFSGLGGWRYALGSNGAPAGRGAVVAAYDVSQVANAVYDLNFGDAPIARELSSIPTVEICRHGANAWFLSPPCQPFCRMGRGRGLEDPRSAAFLRLMDILPQAGPTRLVLENVEGFLGSPAFDLFVGRLRAIGLEWRVFNLCPTQFGIPNRRPRTFIAAGACGVDDRPKPSVGPAPLSDYLDKQEDDGLYLPQSTIDRHGPGMDVVGTDSRRSACFIGGYGKKLVGAGSFLQTERGLRRFSPGEISRLMGYPSGFRFPPGLSLGNRYKLLGNGLNLTVAAWVLDRLG